MGSDGGFHVDFLYAGVGCLVFLAIMLSTWLLLNSFYVVLEVVA